MNLDLTSVFHTPDELADFCMLDSDIQDAFLADVTAKGKAIGFEMACDLKKKNASA
jgi:hypothetical protein